VHYNSDLNVRILMIYYRRQILIIKFSWWFKSSQGHSQNRKI
jgi:hypothetical protein